MEIIEVLCDGKLTYKTYCHKTQEPFIVSRKYSKNERLQKYQRDY